MNTTKKLSPIIPSVDVSVIVPVFNKLALTKNMLASLLETLPQNLVIEVIIVDDASTDETAVWLAGLNKTGLACPQVKSLRVLKNTQNLGYAKSNNLAAKQAQGAILALLNNDLVFTPGWLEPMLAMFEQYPSMPIVVGNLQYRSDTGALDHAGIEVRFDSELKRPIIEHRRDSIPDKPEKVFGVTGACFLIAGQTFDILGGFDEQYLNGGEDVDLCLKLREAGGACWLVPSSSVSHHVSQTRGVNKDRDEKNSWLLFEHWYKQIASGLESSCARLVANSPHEDPLSRRMVAEFITGTRRLAPIAVKAAAQKYVQTELLRLRKIFQACT